MTDADMQAPSSKQSIAIIGAGAWGTALAIHLARVGHDVALWDYDAERAVHMQQCRENERYLPNTTFPENLRVDAVLANALVGVSAVLMVVPSQTFRTVLKEVRQLFEGKALPFQHFAWATKGFEPDSSLLLHQIAQSELGSDMPMAVLSGPTFASEVARGLPTAMVSASEQTEEAQFWADAFHCDTFRMYTQNDMIGVEIGGAYKNIMAIATGLSDGLGLGANARAALISRGMVEMMRLGEALGAKAETLMGLAGLGDLVLTCTDNLSRNRQFGLQIAQSGKTADEVIANIGQVVEGVKAAKAVYQIAQANVLDLPIMMQVYQIITGQTTAEQAVKALMMRNIKAEV